MIKIRNELREHGRLGGYINSTVAYAPEWEGYPIISDINNLAVITERNGLTNYETN